jgi:hypothetical protein
MHPQDEWDEVDRANRELSEEGAAQRERIFQLEEALQLCLMRFRECGAKGHDRIIYMITKLLTKK